MSSARGDDRSSETIAMHVVTDERGRVVGAAHLGRSSDDDVEIGIRPLPGQRVHQVEVPAIVARLERAPHLESFFAAFRLDPDGRLRPPEIELVREDR